MDHHIMNKANFKKDLAILREQVPDNIWLKKLEEISVDWKNYKEAQRIVDRINDSLYDNVLWQNIKTAYHLRGTYLREKG